jgi:hypothetical protein
MKLHLAHIMHNKTKNLSFLHVMYILPFHHPVRQLCRSVSRVTSHGLVWMTREVGFISHGDLTYSSNHNVQTGTESHSAPHFVGTAVSPVVGI